MGVFFQSPTAAARYAQGRIHFHSQVVEAIRHLLALKAPLPWALDVGCGTGHSTVGLRALATNVLGIDLSAAMLGQAQAASQVVYAKASAEKMSLQNDSISLMTVGQAFHWFNARSFYLESSRVLVPGGNLFIYDHYLANSCLDFFDEQFPAPFKDTPINPLELDLFNLRLIQKQDYQQDVVLNLTQTVNYLMTMSAIELAMQTSNSSEIEKNLTAKLAPAFQQGALRFVSTGKIWWVRKEI